jgi:hypothetical protein
MTEVTTDIREHPRIASALCTHVAEPVARTVRIKSQTTSRTNTPIFRSDGVHAADRTPVAELSRIQPCHRSCPYFDGLARSHAQPEVISFPECGVDVMNSRPWAHSAMSGCPGSASKKWAAPPAFGAFVDGDLEQLVRYLPNRLCGACCRMVTDLVLTQVTPLFRRLPCNHAEPEVI